MMNVKKIISLIMLLFMLLPLGAQNSEGKQRYKPEFWIRNRSKN